MVRLDEINREEYMEQIIAALTFEKIDEFRDKYLELHRYDQLDVYITLEPQQRQTLYQFLSPEEFAEIFHGLETAKQMEFIPELDRKYAIEMFRHMYIDDIVSFLGELPDEMAASFLSLLDKNDAESVREIMSYEDETAGAIMTTEFISLSSRDSIQDVMDQLRQRGKEAETIYYLYVVDASQTLVGVVSLRDLITADLNQTIEDIMSTRVVSVSVDIDQEEVANIIRKYDFLAIPVVTLSDKLAGIITVDDVMDIVEQETSEDIGELSAVRGIVDINMSAFESAKKRLPWLIILLFIGMLTAGIISQFEEVLTRVATLAIFIPLIAGMAGNTGTQSLAIVVRGLALGSFDRSAIWRLFRRELSTGFIMGIVCGIVVTIISQLLTGGNIFIGFIIGFSLFCTLIVATIAGAFIPLLINKLKIDPAVASGPFITTINDIVGLLIYFSIAASFLNFIDPI